MKTLLTFFCCIGIILSAAAQAPDIEVDWGKLMKTKAVNFSNIIGADDEHFYTIGPEKTGRLAGLFNNNLIVKKYKRANYQLVKSTAIDEFSYKGKTADFSSAYLHNGLIHLYFKVYNTKLDSRFMIARTIDEKGRLGKPVEVSAVPAERSSDSHFSLSTSSDSSKMLVFSALPYEKKEDEKFQVKVIDRNNELLWERTIVLPYTDKYFTILDQAVTNNGEVLVIGYATPDRTKGEKKKRKQSNQFYRLLHITEDEDDITEFDLDLDNKFINSISLRADFKNNTMAIAGFYSEKDFGGIGGSFYITIDQKTLESKSASVEPFSRDFLTNFMSERKADKGRELGKFVFRDFIEREDGGAVIVAEQHYIYVVTTSTPNGGTSTTTYYVYNDIIALNVNPDGSIAWAAHVPKEQTTANDGGFYLGYMLMVDGDRLHFVYNDHRKNLERISEGKDVKNIGNVRKSVSVVATIEGDGTVTIDQLFRNKDFSAILVPRGCYNTADRQALIYGVKGSKTRFGSLKFL